MEQSRTPSFWHLTMLALCAGMLLGCLIFPRPLEKNPWLVLAECSYYMALGALLLKLWQGRERRQPATSHPS